jgi:hypothetical protein
VGRRALRAGVASFAAVFAAGFGRTLAEQGRAFVEPGGLLGLGAQLAFAFMPLVRGRRSSD